MTDTAPPWKGTPHAAKIESLFLRGRNDEATNLIRRANAEAAEAAATGCKPATGGPGRPVGADSPEKG